MNRVRWLAALLPLLTGQAAWAQMPIFPNQPGVYGGFSSGGGIGASYVGRRFAVSGFYGSSPYGSSFYGSSPYGSSFYGPGFYQPYPFGGYSNTSITIISTPPPQQVPVVIPIVVAPQPIIILPGAANVDHEDDGQFLRVIPRQRKADDAPPAAAPNPALPQGEQAGKFRPIRPEDRMQANQEKAAPKAKPQPAPEKPPADPKEESTRQSAIGKEVFVNQEYGRAERRFEQAVTLAPNDPMPRFLLAEAQFALGKYREAVASIEAGMRLKPEWPLVAFRPKDLYGPNAADYADHRMRLDDAVAKRPNDPALLFLSGYESWFDGKTNEAKALFRRALKAAPDKTFIERFLNLEPGMPVAKN